MPRVNAVDAIVLEVNRRAIKQRHRIGEVLHVALDLDPLAGADDRTAALDVDLGVNVPATGATTAQIDLERIVVAELSETSEERTARR